MLLFLKIMGTIFIAELGDKTQLLLVAMSSRFKAKDIIIGSFFSILTLMAIAVALGSFLNDVIPGWLIKLAAGCAFLYFAASTLRNVVHSVTAEGEADEELRETPSVHPVLTVFMTFFMAELGDKTQLAAVTFSADTGMRNAVLVWAACSVGLCAADLISILIGSYLNANIPESEINLLACAVFLLFGFVTIAECLGYISGLGMFRWLLAVPISFIVMKICSCLQEFHYGSRQNEQ